MTISGHIAKQKLQGRPDTDTEEIWKLMKKSRFQFLVLAEILDTRIQQEQKKNQWMIYKILKLFDKMTRYQQLQIPSQTNT